MTGPSVAAGEGLSALIVPADTPGPSFPRRYTLIRRRVCVLGEVKFDACRVPESHLLGEENAGMRIMVGMFNLERAILGGLGLGNARSAFDIAQAHALKRETFGHTLGTKQLIWSKIADMSWRIDSAESLTYRATKLCDGGVTGRGLMNPAAMATFVATETANYCATETVPILGDDGLTKEVGRAEQIYRDAHPQHLRQHV